MKIAIVGRTNVGKSTLFNRLVGKKSAIVGNVHGVTRDRKSLDTDLFGIHFTITDTPGIDPFSKDSLATSMNNQTLAAMEELKESDLIFFVIDAVDGVTECDKAIASWLRKAFKKFGNRKTILIKNKSECKTSLQNPEILGFGEGISISAEHNLGINDICDALSSNCGSPEPAANSHNFAKSQESDAAKLEDGKKDAVQIAIVGRPNVGKSTLINAIVGSERLLTGDHVGITRDAILLEWKFKNRPIFIIDTAGQRKKSRIQEKMESVAVLDAWKHIKQAHIVVVLMDINDPLENQDITLARKAFDEGKIIIFALNKSDTVSDPKKILMCIKMRTQKEFAQVPNVPCILISAKEKKGLMQIFNLALKLIDRWNKRVTTGVLNRWLQSAIAQNPPPLVNGAPIRIKYASQTNSRPPTFAIFANRVKHLPKSYERYLLNNMRKSLDFDGIPMRIFIRQRKNPHAE